MKRIQKAWLTGSLGVLAIGTLAAFAAPMYPLEGSGSGESATTSSEMKIAIRTSADSEATVVNVPELAPGESRTIRSESGKDVVVTRTEEGYNLKIGDKDFDVMAPGALPGENTKTIVTGDGVKKVLFMKHGYGFTTGEAPAPMSASQFLEKHPLAALDGADARTKETVAKALEELAKKGLVIAPGLESGLPPLDGENVEIRVIRSDGATH
jgi:hypothetical protein